MSTHNSGNDTDFFLSQMKDVKPIKVEEKVVLASPHTDKTSIETRRKAATAELAKDKNFLSGEYIEPLDPLAVIEFKRDGVQHGVYRSLRMGKYQIDARLDLHHMTVEQARTAVFQFVKDCMSNDIRCALITHGKGEGREQPAQLKSCIAHWLPQLDEVMAFHSAQKRHGWVGATYVLLRKSEKKKMETWELHNKR
ncbi:DNA endonuclease SmrA [Cellvibrio sp. PSBB023]|uniref:DNA endonuclease SmrA n=1 Tax=Cellvibrio sp. PSBB023 TaxID=1945512 RepID=UPI00098F2C0C|nr:DNA endonuclease SmrA [Cellvibrio sp. PSBB023]AQT60364.1 DNA endonuclease SmrA [Cellvibrio sp. PSBB023]